MSLAQKIDFPLYCEAAALRLWGPPAQSTERELRWGAHGSRSLDRRTGRWFDHERNEGGSTVELLRRELGLGFGEAAAWLRRVGLLNGPARPHVAGKPTSLGKVTAVYGYTDEAGTLLYEVVRFEPKTFRQRRPDGHWSVKGCRPVLYHLPALLEAVAQRKIVLVVEGEKDCENLRAIGFVATTNAGGVGKWRSDYNGSLRGADVVIVSDNDEAGRNHAEQVTAALRGVSGRVRVLDLAKVWPECPAKGDISNWIEAGGTAEKLAELIERLDVVSATSEGPSVAASVAWPMMDAAAYYGLAGDVVRTIEPHSEADPVALLLQFLTLASNVIGRTPYFQVESDRHHANLFGVLVGESAKARKGTSMGRARAVVKVADETWSADRIKGGLSSGEGLINEVRDERKEWNKKEGREEVANPGATDKRLMIVEPELAGALSAMERHGNMLSPIIRRAWDGDTLSTMTKSSPLKATGAHISVIGHITIEELRARLTRTDAANGFANRFLFALIRRSKELPFGGVLLSDSEILHLGEQLKEAVDKASTVGRVVMTDAARAKWAAVYSALSAAQPGLLGAVTARAEAQTVRLALIYALLDGKGEIDEPHLSAALAVWEYAEASAAHIFGNALGDPMADEILRALQQAGGAGMTRTAISNLFGRNRSADRIGAALALLLGRARARMESRESAGRPAELWFATTGARHG